MGKGLPKAHKRGIFRGLDVPTDLLGGAGGIDYANSEEDTGLQWVNGDPVFQKVLTPTLAIAATTNHQVAHGITGIARLIEMQIVVARESGVGIQLPYSSPFTNYNIQANFEATTIDIYAGSEWNRSTADRRLDDPVILLRYTKT